MNSYIAFTKKELLENFRTFRILILVSVFFLFGMLSPLTAKLMPEIFKSLALDGIVITIPDPTTLDAYSQLFKNCTQMGILVLLLVFSGMLSTEITKGTLINMLTKGLSRSAVILAKFTVAGVIWSLSLLLAFITTFGYTAYLFGNANLPNLIFSIFCLWVYGLFLLSLILLASSFTSGNFGGLTVTAVLIIIMMIVDVFPKIHQFNPIALASQNVSLLIEKVDVSAMIPIVIITVLLTLASLVGSVLIFNKRTL